MHSKFKRYNTIRAGLLSAAICSLALASPFGTALAQLPDSAERAAEGLASPGRVQERLEQRQTLPDVSPRIQVRDLIAQDVPEGAEDIRFNLSMIQFEGVSVYNTQALEPVYANRLGTEISLADVYAIAARLTTKYRNEGYILTQVVVPPQTIEGGVVRLRVVEGFVDSITVDGPDKGGDLNLVRRYASRISTGQALNAAELERTLLLINDLPGVTARSILSPSPRQTGAADLRIIVERDPYDALLAIDNFGSRYLGPVQLSAFGASNSFFGNNERISAQFVLAPDPDIGTELAYMSLAYEQPLNRHGTKVRATASHTSTEPGYDLDQFGVKGRSQFLAATLSHPFIRSRTKNLYADLTFDWRDIESRNRLEATREDRIRAARLGMRYEFLDTLLGVGINSVNLQVSKGLDIFGSSDKNDQFLTRTDGDPTFLKANAEIQRLQRLYEKLNILVVARGQISDGPLLSSEEFGVGGFELGRGFDPSEIIGDEGIAGKVELQWNQPYPWNFVQDYQLYSFFDAGRVWNDDATTSSQKKDTITSAGFGIRADFMEQTEAGFGVAFPLNRDVQTQNDDDPRVYMNLSRRF